ncbi:DUF4982 domain-containing protein [Reichenbachiella carrageenanivorans]|uniref:DUF4982 domain-containing protein n=1 Tax=Reichenbachiella carrageenanivorans TaxID=2979869 RepID=A0ABY6D4K3_9BACT|nr:glycoside hydrolase family 2 TIM barrel-domain containing protein [Reichenbachiella carrageenanivorans]UXX81091.1 DUF4982 domain-containing protein [Reichenbachiella carrageenanivorans]
MRKAYIYTTAIGLWVSWCVCASSFGQAVVQTTVRSQAKFNKNWKFEQADNPVYRSPDFDDTAWRTLDLPHDWSIEGDYSADHPSGARNGYFPEGIGWYRKSFILGDSLTYKQLAIQFDGVFMNSEVWINGHFLGRYPYGYNTFQYGLTEFLHIGDGQENVLAVRVDNSLPEATRWYNGSGIYRNVHLITTNYTHFNNYDGVFVTTPVAQAERAVIHIDYRVIGNLFSKAEIDKYRANKWKKEKVQHACTLRSIVYDAQGQEVARVEQQQSLENFDKHIAYAQELEVKSPKRWSADTPYMYYLKSEIEYEGKILDDKVTPFGIRHLEYHPDKGMLVNEKQVKLKGVSLHHDGGSVGAAVPDKIWYYRLKKWKEMGCNAIRTTHNPFSPEFYNMCDTMGFYVLNEAFDEWTMGWAYNFSENNRGKADNGYQHYFDQWAETDLRAMIRRDRNHPSVVMYSIGNEIPDQLDKLGGQKAQRLVAICHEEDPTRPVTAGNDQAVKGRVSGLMDALDISGYNYVARHHKEEMYAPERALRPDKLCIGTETSLTLDYFLAYRDNDYVLGQFVWVGQDYLGEAKKAPQRGWQRGLLDVSGNPRPSFYQHQSYWSETPVIHMVAAKDSVNGTLRSSWNWDKKDKMFLSVYTNCDEVELSLNGKSLGRKKVDPDTYLLEWPLSYQPGELKAKGYTNRKVVAEHVLKTTGRPSEVVAHPVWTQLVADNQDISILEVSLVDKYGRIVPEAVNEVNVTIDGPARLLGIDSGDLYYEGKFSDPKRNATRGKMLVIIQAKDTPGEVRVKLASEKLKPAEITLEVK